MLLGEPKESTSGIITTSERFNNQGFHINFFDERVSESRYVTELIKSDLLISPDRVHVNRDSRHVIRGQTKSTGAVGDAIQSGTPLVLPDNYCVPKEYDDLIYKYRSSDHMATFIRRFLNSSAFRESIHDSTTEIVKKFSKTQQGERFNKVRDDAINMS